MSSRSWPTKGVVFGAVAFLAAGLTGTEHRLAARADEPQLTVAVSIGGPYPGRVTMTGTRSPGGYCIRHINYRTADDLPVLLELFPQGPSLHRLLLTEPTPEVLAELLKGHPEIQSLHLEGDQVTDEDMKHLAGLGHLRDLQLATPHVTDKGLAVLAQLRELESVNFWCGVTPVTDKGLKALSELPNLKCLWLDKTRITDAGLSRLRRLSKLKRLDVSGTHVGRIKEWPDMPALREFSCSGTGIGDDDIPHLARYSRLQRLTLNETKITGKNFDALVNLKDLWEISATRTLVTDDGVAQLAGLPKLSRLWLAWTPLTDNCLPHLAELKELTYADLGRTKVTEAPAVDFSKKHPRLHLLVNSGAFEGGKRWISPGERDELSGRDRGP
jgi:Leucine-rich repeat (LRR) protein